MRSPDDPVAENAGKAFFRPSAVFRVHECAISSPKVYRGFTGAKRQDKRLRKGHGSHRTPLKPRISQNGAPVFVATFSAISAQSAPYLATNHGGSPRNVRNFAPQSAALYHRKFRGFHRKTQGISRRPHAVSATFQRIPDGHVKTSAPPFAANALTNTAEMRDGPLNATLDGAKSLVKIL